MTNIIAKILGIYFIAFLINSHPAFSQFRSDFLVDPDTTFSTFNPATAIDEDGNWHIIYGVRDSTGDFIKHTKLNSDGMLIQTPQLVSAYGFTRLNGLSIANREDHLAFVFNWGFGGVGFGKAIGMGLLSTSGEIISPGSKIQLIEQDPDLLSASADFIEVTFATDSTYFIVYDALMYPYQQDVIILQKGLISGELLHSVYAVNADSTTEHYFAGIPIVISNPDNENIVIIWQDNSSKQTYQIYGRVYDVDGTPRSSRLTLVEDSNLSGFRFAAADMDAAGDFILVWAAQMDTVWNIYMRRFFPDGTPKNSTTQVNDSDDTGFSPLLDVSIDLDGKFIIVWEEKVSQQQQIFAQRFSNEGEPISRNFRLVVNVMANREQAFPSVSLHNDRIYTVWHSEPLPGQQGKEFVWGNIQDFNNPVSVRNPDSHPNPSDFQLYQNYPNPFNPVTQFSYTLNKTGFVQLVIYNILGKKIRTLVLKTQCPGEYEIQWDGGDDQGGIVASGVYYYQLAFDGHKQTKKMLLIR